MNERRPRQAGGPAVDPWEGEPLYPDWYGLHGYTERPLVVPVIPGPDGAREPSWRDFL